MVPAVFALLFLAEPLRLARKDDSKGPREGRDDAAQVSGDVSEGTAGGAASYALAGEEAGCMAMRAYGGVRMAALLGVAFFMFMEISAITSLVILYISNTVRRLS